MEIMLSEAFFVPTEESKAAPPVEDVREFAEALQGARVFAFASGQREAIPLGAGVSCLRSLYNEAEAVFSASFFVPAEENKAVPPVEDVREFVQVLQGARAFAFASGQREAISLGVGVSQLQSLYNEAGAVFSADEGEISTMAPAAGEAFFVGEEGPLAGEPTVVGAQPKKEEKVAEAGLENMVGCGMPRSALEQTPDYGVQQKGIVPEPAVALNPTPETVAAEPLADFEPENQVTPGLPEKTSQILPLHGGKEDKIPLSDIRDLERAVPDKQEGKEKDFPLEKKQNLILGFGRAEMTGMQKQPASAAKNENLTSAENARPTVFAGSGPSFETSSGSTVLPPGLTSRVVEPVLEGIQVQYKSLPHAVGEIRIRLKPESLGEVFIQISRDEGGVTGRILVENLMVKEVLESHLSLLRDRLTEMNVDLKEVQVSLGSAPDKENNANSPGRQAWNPGRQRLEALDAVAVKERATTVRGMLDTLA